MSIPTATREDLLRAMAQFDEELRDSEEWRAWQSKENYRYAIEHEGRQYPVKFIIELATGHPRQYFSGGDRANNFVRDLGFSVTELARASPDGEDRWSEFLYWGKRHHDLADFDAIERDYKLRLVEQLQRGKAAILEERTDWFDDVKRSLTGDAHPLHFIVADNFRKWYAAHPDEVVSALRTLWDASIGVAERVQRFDDALPRDTFKSRGVRLSLISFLHMAMDPADFPPYRAEPIHTAYRLTSFKPLHWQAPIVDQYMEFLGFLDLLISEAAKCGMRVKDRLDAQGIIWTVVKWGPSEDWPESDQRAMREYLGWKVEEPEVEPSTFDVETEASDESPTTLSKLADQLLVSEQSLEEIQRLLSDKRQIVFYGPPGTGKTYIARELAFFLANALDANDRSKRVKIVQFHPSYAYEDFVQGYRPWQGSDGAMQFALVDGPLMEIAEAARSQPDVTHVLVIDEINRGNVAKVLGELYFLLEYREEAITLQYSSEDFKLPENLWIIGTMNTADRSIALIDAALRRRFYFVPFFPDEPPIEGLLHRWLEREEPNMLWVAGVVDRANRLLGDRHGAIGPSYFMKDELDEEWVERIWKHAVMPYLEEQFFGEEDRLAEFALDRLRVTSDGSSETADTDASSESE